VAGAKVNLGRAMQPEPRRTGEHYSATRELPSGSLGFVPTTFATAYRYTGLGYTTVFDAAVAPLLARLAHRDLDELPNLDNGCFLLVGNDRRLLELLAAGDRAAARDYYAWLLTVARGYAPKLVNPGGVESWKQGRAGDAVDLDEPLPDLPLTARQILEQTARLGAELNLPHPLHVHCNNLGLPGNWRTTLATMQTLAGLRAHLTHIQFHSYAGGPGDNASFGSAVEPLVEWFNAHPELSVDIGQVLFGPTISMTGDSAAAQYLSRITGGIRVNHDLECVGGCGVFPIEYQARKLAHAWQFAIGLEWFLKAVDPWRLALTTDHPNGAVFWRYPYLIRLLMNAAFRNEQLQQFPRAVRDKCGLTGLSREYTLDEICIITRAAPARLLGLTDRGHLGPGARADVTIYLPQDDKEAMFALPVYTVQAGRIVLERGEVRLAQPGERLRVMPGFDRAAIRELNGWFGKKMSLPVQDFAFAEEEGGA